MSGGDHLLQGALENIRSGSSKCNSSWRSFVPCGIGQIIEEKIDFGELHSSNGQSQQEQQNQDQAPRAAVGPSLVAGGQFRKEFSRSELNGEERGRIVQGAGFGRSARQRQDLPYAINEKAVHANCSKEPASHIPTVSARGRGRGYRRGEGRGVKRVLNMEPAKSRGGGRRSSTNLADHVNWMSSGDSSSNRVSTYRSNLDDRNDLHMKVRGGTKDRHSKVQTAKGLRDRRVRLSAPTAIQFFDVQDRLGLDQPSQAIDWLISKARSAIGELPEALSQQIASGDTNQQQHQVMVHPPGRLKEEQPSAGSCISSGGGVRAELRAKARERARERAKEKCAVLSVSLPDCICNEPECAAFKISGGGRESLYDVHVPPTLPLAQPASALSLPASTTHSKSSSNFFGQGGQQVDHAFADLLNAFPIPSSVVAMLGSAPQTPHPAPLSGSGCPSSSLFFSPRGTLQSIFNPVPALPPGSANFVCRASLPSSSSTYHVNDTQKSSEVTTSYFNEQTLHRSGTVVTDMSNNIDMAHHMHMIASAIPGAAPMVCIPDVNYSAGFYLNPSRRDGDEFSHREQCFSVVPMGMHGMKAHGGAAADEVKTGMAPNSSLSLQ